MKKLHFEAPEDWDYYYEAGYEDGVDADGDYVDTVYVETLSASNKEESQFFHVTVFHNSPPIGARDLLEEEVVDYLNNSGFIMPEYMKPSLEALIGECQIAGYDSYYFLKQRPEEEKADIRLIFESSDYKLVYIDATIDDWRDEGLMICFLKERLSFIDE